MSATVHVRNVMALVDALTSEIKHQATTGVGIKGIPKIEAKRKAVEAELVKLWKAGYDRGYIDDDEGVDDDT